MTKADMYGGPGAHGFYQALEVTPNGILMAGSNGGPGDSLRLLLNFITAVQDPSPSVFTDLHYTANGEILAVGNSQSSGLPALMRFDANLLPIWTRQVSGLNSIEQVVEDPANGDIYVVGTGNFAGMNRAVVIKLMTTAARQFQYGPNTWKTVKQATSAAPLLCCPTTKSPSWTGGGQSQQPGPRRRFWVLPALI
ncbi:MAG: hypothetical protein IPN33_22080 [Saprospiraceae bacterium]|nr:hypothetical protein [Saprospiraceae bacterium]